MESSQLKNIVEAALLAAGSPLTVGQLQALFGDKDAPEKQEIRAVLKELAEDYAGRGIELREVASGFRVQVMDSMSPWLSKLWEERPPRYSRALMETLAIIAYRQPVTRGDIEEIRGVSVTSNIIRTLLEREWIKVVGHRDVPGKPAMFGTTRSFLDYFGLKKLDDLPPLAELANLEPVGVQLELEGDHQAADGQGSDAAPEGDANATAEGLEKEGAEHEGAEDAAPDAMLQSSAHAADSDQANGEPAGEQGVSEADAVGESVDELDDDEDLDLSDDELAAAQARIDAITTELAGNNEAGQDAGDQEDTPPGSVKPLVGLNAPGQEPPEPATVTSLDDARAAADKAAPEQGSGDESASADVVPINKS